MEIEFTNTAKGVQELAQAVQDHEENGVLEIKVVVGDLLVLTACVAPTCWPLFLAKKQHKMASGKVFFKRAGEADRERSEYILDQLVKREGLVVAVIGTPGVAKSASLNEIAFHLVSKLGQNGFPPMLGLRVNQMVLLFEWKDDSGTVEVSVRNGSAGDSTTKSELYCLSEHIEQKNGVLLVEADEAENAFAFGCTTLISLSSRRANDALKHNAKSPGSAQYLVGGSWSKSESTCAGLVEFALGRKDLGETCGAVEEEISKRWMEVGGILRAVLGRERAFEARVAEQDQVDVQNLDWNQTSVWDVGTWAKLFICPEPGTTGALKYPSKLAAHISNVQWRFLSPSRAHHFSELVSKSNMTDVSAAVNSLKQFGLEWQVQEEFVCDSLLANEEEKKTELDWEWYSDPGAVKLDASSMLSNPPAGFQRLKHVEFFEGKVFRRDIKTLQESTLYRSSGWQMVVCEYFSFSAANKIVFLYQVSSKLPAAHAFTEKQCDTWRKALELPDDWTLSIVYFLDKSKKQLPKVPCLMLFAVD